MKPAVVTVLLFGPAREAAGAERVEIEVFADTTAGSVLEALVDRFPVMAAWIPRARVAVNRAYVAPDTPVDPADEIAVIPPVGGG